MPDRSNKNKKEIRVRRWKKKDLPALVECHRAAYGDYPSRVLYDERLYGMQLSTFPEGQFLAEIDGKVVGYATSIILQISDDERYTYDELTGTGTFMTHNPTGDTLYGADIAVHPKYRGRGIAGKLYERRQRLVRRLNLRRMIAYGRLPGYSAISTKMSAEDYVQAVVEGRLDDPALNAHLKAGYRIQKVVLDLTRDTSSLNYATLLAWDNPVHAPEKRRIASPPLQRPARRIRVCAAQYLMRRIDDYAEFEHTVEFFADAANEYHCHFLVLPELFTSQVLYTLAHEREIDNPMEVLSTYHERYLDMFHRLATKYRLYIIGGSTPVRRANGLFNVAHLFTPAGNVYTQDKLHVTPVEQSWGIHPGEKLRVFDTPFGRMAIQVCYDIEFPELARILTLAGVEVIFVPFSTDERKGYMRIRYTSQARAVENYLYVVVAGNAGNLPSIKNYLVNFAQSAIFTPSDFAFPFDAIAGQADPNVENVVIAELDLTTLEQQREIGTVRPFFDRRPDLYQVTAVEPVEVIRID